MKSPQATKLKPRDQQAGFTLVELLVAIVIMALLAILSWRGLDGMTRVQTATQTNTDGVLALQAGLSQWQADLDALAIQANVFGVPGLNYDGQVLRLTRRYAETGEDTKNTTNDDSIRVVAWSQRNAATDINTTKTQWLRWQSAPVKTRGELQAAWAQAKQWASNATEAEKKGEVVVATIDKWQVFYYRNDAWSNAMSSADLDALIPGSNTAQLPDGVRLVLTLAPGQALVGTITRDWVSPVVGGGK
jgi:general secretion pathway protein J